MAKNNVADLLSVGSLFTTQAERDEAQRETIRDIPLEEISDFPNHPFKVRMDASMMEMVDSVKQHGVLVPALVRPKPDGGYEMIAGHRRRKASELAEKQTLSCIVRDMTDDEATIVMVDSNLQREQILPSEKAFAYKMKLDAMKRQAGRPSKDNLRPVGADLIGTRSDELLAENSPDSARQIQRYIRLTHLTPEILDLVDNSVLREKDTLQISLRPAVELSYLDEDCQRAVVDEIDLNQATPSHAQTIRMRQFFTDGKLTPEVISAIMSEEKPNQREKIVLRGDKVRGLIPKNIPVSQTEDYVVKALEHYNRFLRQRTERDSR